VAAASVAAATLIAGTAVPATTAAAGGEPGSPGAAADLAAGHAVQPQASRYLGNRRVAAGAARAQPENPALVARQALAERYAQAVRAARRKAAAERAGRQAAISAARRNQASVRGQQPPGTPQQIAMAMLPSFGWPASEFSCLNALWAGESGWNPYASNPSTGAYGIPQALPGSKMATAGPDWQSDAATQIRWGLGYIRATYGSPCAAWGHEESAGWY
jgi:hypothetical protein